MQETLIFPSGLLLLQTFFTPRFRSRKSCGIGRLESLQFFFTKGVELPPFAGPARLTP